MELGSLGSLGGLGRLGSLGSLGSLTPGLKKDSPRPQFSLPGCFWGPGLHGVSQRLCGGGGGG